jgi:ATP-dependent Clp protease ATP-binding subunit ClpA
MFTPEFRNRLDATIAFNNLTPEVIRKVVDKFVMQLEEQLADRGVTIEMTDAAKTWLGEKGYDPQFGARPLGRVIQEHLKKQIADELLFGKLVNGGTAYVDMKDNALSIVCQPGKGKKKKDDGEEGEPTGEPPTVEGETPPGDKEPEIVQ